MRLIPAFAAMGIVIAAYGASYDNLLSMLIRFAKFQTANSK
jgi:hypothetical protein